MLFSAPTLDGLVAGRVDATYRRWSVVRPKVGSRVTTKVGMVEITGISRVDEADLTDTDARSAGFDSLLALLRWTGQKGSGDLYRIGIALAGPDPRVALRETTELSPDDVATLDSKLDRMDRAADEPWTRRTLDQIRRSPGVVSTELAAEVGEPRQFYKLRVRRLKALGLTESLEVGYRLSARGEAYREACNG